MHSVRTRTYSTYRICTTRNNGIPLHSATASNHPFQPTRSLFLRLSISSSVLFAEALKIQDLRRTEATRKVCAIHSLQRSVVNISGKSIPSPPPRILLSEDLLLLSTMLGKEPHRAELCQDCMFQRSFRSWTWKASTGDKLF